MALSGTQLFGGECRFVSGIASLHVLPPVTHPEVAFIGRSNVGKSSLINALTNRTQLARASVTPGRTQQLNFFLLAETLMLVDLPGYGYAEAPKKQVDAWNTLITGYLKGRPNLKRVLVLIDARRGVMKTDEEMMDMLDEAAVSYRIVLTKADKLATHAQDKALEAVAGRVARRPAAYPDVLITSSETKHGIDTLRDELAALLTQ